MRLLRIGLMPVAVLVAVLAAGIPASANMENVKSFKQAYPGKDAKAYSCKACHEGAIGKKTDINAYGKALAGLKEKGSNPSKLTVEDYRAVEADDTDGDGSSNIDEINAGTSPSDPASKPSARLAPFSANQRLAAYLEELLVPSVWAKEEAGPVEGAKKAEYVGTETCASCHAREFKEFQRSTHARISVPDVTQAQGCEMCHGPGSLHVEAGGGRGVGGIKNPSKDPSACFECHMDKKAEFRLPNHHPVLEGKMSCTDCHDPHGEDVRPWSATSLKDTNETCFRCHKEQRGPFVWEHEGIREGCTTCHKVHGSIHPKMLLARDANLCLRCHTQVAFPTIGNRSHSGFLPGGTCFSAGCHTAVHGSNFDDHLRY